jgi:hypothetical protein
MGGSGQLGQPIGGQLGQIVRPNGQPTPATTGATINAAPAPTMQPTQTGAQPPSGAVMGGGALSSAAAPNQAKNPGAAQATFGGT